MADRIPLSVPNFEGNEEQYVLDAVQQGWVSTGGAYVDQFEKNLAVYLQAPAVVVCQSGTSALHLALMECGVQAGELVVVPTLTFIAAVNPVRYQKARPIFMDCDDSLCMDPVKLEAFCETECTVQDEMLLYKRTGQRIRAIVVVHVFGNLADLDRIMEIAQRYYLKVIEDATEALGSRYLEGHYAGRLAGTIGDFGAFSFNGNKIITTGGGGAVTARETEALAHMKYISTQAKDDALFYVHNEVGYNYRMTNLQAALGVAQLEQLPEFIQRKQKNYAIYQELLSEAGMGILLPFREGTDSNKWFYSIKLPIEEQARLQEIIWDLQEQGIQVRPIWSLIHKQAPYRDEIVYKIEQAECYAKQIVNLPCSTNLQEDQIVRVVDALRKVWSASA